MTEEISYEIQTSRLAFKYTNIKILKLHKDYNLRIFIHSLIYATIYILNQKPTILFLAKYKYIFLKISFNPRWKSLPHKIFNIKIMNNTK